MRRMTSRGVKCSPASSSTSPRTSGGLLVEVAHLDVADLVGMQVDFGHLGEDEIQQPGAVETADLGVEIELLDDVAGVRIEGGNQAAGCRPPEAGRQECGGGSAGWCCTPRRR